MNLNDIRSQVRDIKLKMHSHHANHHMVVVPKDITREEFEALKVKASGNTLTHYMRFDS